MAAEHDATIDLVRNHTHRMLVAGVALAEWECLRQAQTWDAWFDGFCAAGERYEALADEAAAAGRRATAAAHYASAAAYYHFGQFMYYINPERKAEGQQRKVDAYRKAIPWLTPPAEPVGVAHRGATLRAYFRKPASGGQRSPCVVLVPGLEATKEELRTSEDVYLARGMATLSFDGPGQGETLADLALDDRYHEAVSALVDEMVCRPDVDPGRLAIVGVSLGGLLAPIAAAHDQRLRACAVLGGTFDMASRWDRANALSRLGYVHVTHARDEAQAREEACRWSVAPVAGRLVQPTLVIHGARDRVVPVDQAEMFPRFVRSAQLVIHPDGNHVCHNMAHIVRPMVADWVAAQLA